MHKKEKERLGGLFVWSTLYDIYNKVEMNIKRKDRLT
jgi:hypothetical protein